MLTRMVSALCLSAPLLLAVATRADAAPDINGKQRIVLRAGGVVILLLAIFPPWRVQSYAPAANNITLSCDIRAGRSFLFRPPDPVEGKPMLGDALIDLPQLLAEWVIVAALTWLASSFFQDVRPTATEAGSMQGHR